LILVLLGGFGLSGDWSDPVSLVVGVSTASCDPCGNVPSAEAISSVQQVVPSTQNPNVLGYRGTQRCPRLDVIELQERPRPAAPPVR
jgi:hypothetical protein